MTEPARKTSDQREERGFKPKQRRTVKLMIATLPKNRDLNETAKQAGIAWPEESSYRSISGEDLRRIEQRIAAVHALCEHHFESRMWAGTTQDLPALQRLLDASLIDPTNEQALKDVGLALGPIPISTDPQRHWVRLDDPELGTSYSIQYGDRPLWQHPEHMALKRVEMSEPVDLEYLMGSAEASIQFALKRLNRPQNPILRVMSELAEATSSFITRIRSAR